AGRYAPGSIGRLPREPRPDAPPGSRIGGTVRTTARRRTESASVLPSTPRPGATGPVPREHLVVRLPCRLLDTTCSCAHTLLRSDLHRWTLVPAVSEVTSLAVCSRGSGGSHSCRGAPRAWSFARRTCGTRR